MYAIIEDSGTQIRVETGSVVDIDVRELPDEATPITFDKVLLIGSGDGDTKIGTPYLSGASVEAEVLGEVQGEKLTIMKFRRRKGYRRKTGHRQVYLRVRIGAING
ncbi:MAG: 50S ribosomal protein L21 [Phycisphaeraceae bacterium]|nr:50S ribosomal protein L21 [Phycisphaeraceae bacterium]